MKRNGFINYDWLLLFGFSKALIARSLYNSLWLDNNSKLCSVKLINHPEKENTNNTHIIAKTAIIKSIERCPINKA